MPLQDAVPPRIQLLLSRWGRVLIVILLVVAVGSFFLAWNAYTTTDTRTVTREVNRQSVATTVGTSALVTVNTTLYDEGERLEDMPIYILGITPNMTVTVRTEVTNSDRVTVSHELTIVHEASFNNQPFFSTSRTILNRTQQTTQGAVESTASMNVSRVDERADRLRGQLGEIGVFQTRVHLTVTYRTGSYSGELASDVPLSISGGGYRLGGDLGSSRTHSETVTQRVTEPSDPASYLGLAGLGILSILAAVGLELFIRRIDVEALRLEIDHSQFDEWISQGEFPTKTDKTYISINELEDLVDIAIDSNKRVVYDTDINTYAVVDGDLVYYFTRDPFSVEAWLDT